MGLLYALFKADEMRRRVASAPQKLHGTPLGIKALFRDVYHRGYYSPITAEMWQGNSIMARPAEDDGHFGIEMAKSGSLEAYEILEPYFIQGCIPVLMIPHAPYDEFANVIIAYGMVTKLWEL